MIAVVDASAAAAHLLGEPQGASLDSLLEAVRDGELRILVPPLFWYEMLNVMVMAERRAARLPVAVEALLQMVEGLPFESDEDLTPPVQRRIAGLARRHSLTAYDAAYLELAERVKAQRLLTFDRDLLALAADYAFLRQ